MEQIIETQRRKIVQLEDTIVLITENLKKDAELMKQAYTVIDEYQKRHKDMVEARQALTEIGNMSYRGLLHVIVLFFRRKWQK